MENKIVKLQLAICNALKVIFEGEKVEIFTSLNKDSLVKNFVHIESIKKEREGSVYAKFTVVLKIKTLSLSVNSIAAIIEKIESKLQKESVEGLLLTNFTSFNLMECMIYSDKNGDFAGNITIICFF